MPKRLMFDNEPPESLSAYDLAREINLILHSNKASKAEMLSEYAAWRAAWYVMTGKEMYADDTSDVNYAKLASVKNQLQQMGIGRYASQMYMNTKPAPYPQDLNYSAFLREHIQELELEEPESGKVTALLDGLNRGYNYRRGQNQLTCYEFMRDNLRDRVNTEGVPYEHRDRSTYEYEADADTWKKYTAMSACIQGVGSEVLSAKKVEQCKNAPFDNLMLRNKRTVEKVNRGEYDNVQAARKKVIDSFTFNDEHDFNVSKHVTSGIFRSMINRGEGDRNKPEIKRKPEYHDLMLSIQDYLAEPNRLKAAEKSANILVAVEKFTKGRKSNFASTEDRWMVNQAMNILAAAVPDAVHNPSVKPLLDRFHKVRKYRLQSDLEFPDHQFKSALDTNAQKRPVSGDPYRYDADEMAEGESWGRQQNEQDIQKDLYGEPEPERRAAPRALPPKPERRQKNPTKIESPKIPEKRDPINKNDYVNPKDRSDMEKELYGAEDSELEPEFEKNEQNPIRVSKAYEPVRDFINVITEIQEEAGNLKKDYLMEKFARMVALNQMIPSADAPDLIDENEISRRAEELQKDPVIELMADQYRENESIQKNMLIQAQKKKDGGEYFGSGIGQLYDTYRADMQKNPQNYKDYLKQPEIRAEEPKVIKQPEERQPGVC